MVSQQQAILTAALERFARQGIQATSIQDIADHAGVSKANVLYHFTSKEHLTNAVLTPALDALENLLEGVSQRGGTSEDFLEAFVDFLIGHRLATHIVIGHPYLVDDFSSLRRARDLMGQLAGLIDQHSPHDIDQLRVGVAIAGASYALVSASQLGVDQLSDTELRPLLVEVLVSMTLARTAGGSS